MCVYITHIIIHTSTAGTRRGVIALKRRERPDLRYVSRRKPFRTRHLVRGGSRVREERRFESERVRSRAAQTPADVRFVR